MVFDVKIYIAGSHQVEPTKAITFLHAISWQDSIEIAFLWQWLVLNDLDIQSAYLNAKVAGKVHTLANKEFGHEKEGYVVVLT